MQAMFASDVQYSEKFKQLVPTWNGNAYSLMMDAYEDISLAAI